ncbi:GNAT family N-acetyltransferase [Nocardioides terrisoli]|uniref:GNAT family N-acetyltransferase n=1 Tax=Nocardioides terrisoli TaxID=3388267 RepID=UPI00287BACCA|nr:GNAT family N-acetyltransferase [Nocardioides marmorisolisilvae]
MRRQPMPVRDAVPEDAAALVLLWSEAGPSGEPLATFAEEVPRALAHVAADPDERVVVGESDGAIVAMMHLRRAPLTPLHLEQVVHTSFLLVRPEYRRHGYAHALLETAVAWAEEKDIAHVSAAASSASRDTNRFLARLGLGTVGTYRMAATATLRKKLTPPAPGPRSRNVGQVLAARRSMRRRRALTDADD